MSQSTYINNSGNFQPPTPGLYAVQFSLSGFNSETVIGKNGVGGGNYNQGTLVAQNQNTAGGEASISAYIYLNGTDYVSISAYNTGSAAALNNRSNVQFALITPA